MNALFILAQIFGIFGTICNILSMTFKKRKQIFIMLILVNSFSAANFICLGSYSASLIDIFSNVQMFINNIFEKRGKPIPKVLVAIYITVIMIIGLITSTTSLNYLIIVGSIIYTFTILMKNEQQIRLLWIFVLVFYLIYDAGVGAYAFMISCLISIAVTIMSMIRYGKQPEQEKNKKA